MQPNQKQQLPSPQGIKDKMLTVQHALAMAGYMVIRKGKLLLITSQQTQQKAV